MSSTQRDRKTKKGSKDVAAERLSTPEQLDQIIRIAGFPSWLALGALLTVLIAGLWASFAIPVPITVRGQGILINPGGILAVVSETEGRLVRLLVGLDDAIARDQVVAEIAQPAIEQEIAGNLDATQQALRRREMILSFQEKSSQVQDEGISSQREALRERYGSARTRLQNLEDLLTKQRALEGFYSEVQLRETADRINDARDELNTINNEIEKFGEVVSSRNLGHQRELLQLDLEISDLEREAQRLQSELEQKTKVRSPYAGKVVEIKVNQGDVIARHDDLFSLLPLDGGGDVSQRRRSEQAAAAPREGLAELCLPAAEGDEQRPDSLVAVLYVPSADGKKIEFGDVVQLELAPFKREKFGFLLGCVEEIAEVPSTRKGMMRVLQNIQLVEQLSGAVAPFEVRVRLLHDPKTATGYRWSSGDGPPERIYVGTLGDAYIVTEELRPIDILLPNITQTLGLGS